MDNSSYIRYNVGSLQKEKYRFSMNFSQFYDSQQPYYGIFASQGQMLAVDCQISATVDRVQSASRYVVGELPVQIDIAYQATSTTGLDTTKLSSFGLPPRQMLSAFPHMLMTQAISEEQYSCKQALVVHPGLDDVLSRCRKSFLLFIGLNEQGE